MNTKLAVLALFAGLTIAACDGSNPTQPDLDSLVLQKATVSVEGVIVNGTTVTRGHGARASTRFEAHLAYRSGNPAIGHTVRILYRRPNGSGSMMDGGRMALYDDGTHGDRVPGDGIYCYEDFAGDFGCHGQSAPLGRHDYDFFGMDATGTESNHMLVTVTVIAN